MKNLHDLLSDGSQYIDKYNASAVMLTLSVLIAIILREKNNQNRRHFPKQPYTCQQNCCGVRPFITCGHMCLPVNRQSCVVERKIFAKMIFWMDEIWSYHRALAAALTSIMSELRQELQRGFDPMASLLNNLATTRNLWAMYWMFFLVVLTIQPWYNETTLFLQKWTTANWKMNKYISSRLHTIRILKTNENWRIALF